MQRASTSITSVSPSDKAIDNTATREQSCGFRTIGMLLTIIPLASALIFVDPVAPSAEAHPECNRRTHTEGNVLGTFERWRVKNVVSIGGGLKEVFWQYQPQGEGPWYNGGSITCRG